MKAQRTEYELSKVFLREPTRCAETRSGFRLCRWWLGAENPGYPALARLVETDRKISVLCELPMDGSARAEDSCSVHRHQEQELRRAYGSAEGYWADRDTERPERKEARRELTEPRTALALSQLLGDAPQACAAIDGTTRECIWQLEVSTPAYTKAIWAFVNENPFQRPHPKLRLICAFPADGSPRAKDSCRAEPLGRHAGDVTRF